MRPVVAGRRDRSRRVVPQLHDAVDKLEAVVGAAAESYLEAEQLLHRRIVELCGNATLSAVVGVLETLSATQLKQSLELAARHGIGPNRKLRAHALEAHRRIAALIEEGEVDEVGEVFRWHRRHTRSLESLPYEQLIRVSVPNSAALRAR